MKFTASTLKFRLQEVPIIFYRPYIRYFKMREQKALSKKPSSGSSPWKCEALFGKIKPRKIRNEKVIQGGTIINEDRAISGRSGHRRKITPNHSSGTGNTEPGSSGNRCQSLFRYSGGNRRSGAFSEPGLTHKGNIREGNRYAAAGGCYFFYGGYAQWSCRLPLPCNCWKKQEIAGRNFKVNYSFYLGATTDKYRWDKNVSIPITTLRYKSFYGFLDKMMLMRLYSRLWNVCLRVALAVATHCEDHAHHQP